MAARSTKKANNVFSKGNIVFLTKFGIKDQPELVLEVDDYNDAEKIVTSNKLVLVQKEIHKEKEMMQLVPLGNAFIFSSVNNEGDVIKAGVTHIKVDNFDMFGIVENQEIIEVFNKSFSVEEQQTPASKPTRVKKSNALQI